MTDNSGEVEARVVEAAIEQAERELNPPPSNWERPAFVTVPIKWIMARPDLFQVPDLDLEHVEDLAARIARNESIDPPLVMKIGGKWICVDGHHRIAAHRKIGSHGVTSEWFDGTVREAVDEHLRHLRRNKATGPPTQQGLSPTEKITIEDARVRLVNALRHPLLSVVRAVSVQQRSSTTKDRVPFDANTAETVRSSSFRSRVVRRPPFQVVNQEELQAASYAALRAHAISETATALVSKLASMVEDCTIKAGLRKNKRTGTVNKLEYGTGAFLADLLRPWCSDESNGWLYRSLKKASFTGAAVKRRTFEQLIDGLKGLAFLDHVLGHHVADDPYEDRTQYASRFRATPALLSFCSEHGVEPAKAVEHFEFEYDLPEHPVELRARKDKDYFGRTVPTGRVMEFERTEAVENMENRVRELNAFFAKQTLRGGSHHGYVRIFSNGDDPDFDWNKGGRFYSQHLKDSYQLMHNTRRRMMTINGEPVAEIDISASYLTIFLSMHGIQLDITKDPYAVPGFAGEHRTAVKQWFVATFGNAKPIRKWPPRMLKDRPELSQYRVATITDAIMSKYPAMATWGEPLHGRIVSWADLMFSESDVMFGAMLKLMYIDHTPSLSVHDSLIVPASKVEEAKEAITHSLHAKHRVVPILKINPPLTSPLDDQGGTKGEDREED